MLEFSSLQALFNKVGTEDQEASILSTGTENDISLTVLLGWSRSGRLGGIDDAFGRIKVKPTPAPKLV